MSKLRALSILAALAVAYSALVFSFAPHQGWSWGHSLIASTVAFLFAVLCGMYLFDWQRAQEAQNRRKDHRAVLGAELGDIRRILFANEGMTVTLGDGTPVPILITYVQPLAIEDAALSGLFSSIETENLLHVARKIRLFNIKTQHTLAALSSPNGEALLSHAARNLEETRVAVLDSIEFLEHKLSLSLSIHVE